MMAPNLDIIESSTCCVTAWSFEAQKKYEKERHVEIACSERWMCVSKLAPKLPYCQTRRPTYNEEYLKHPPPQVNLKV